MEKPPAVTMQQLLDAGFNAFGLQLFVESVAAIAEKEPKDFPPFSFSYKGVLVTFMRDPDRPLDGRHE